MRHRRWSPVVTRAAKETWRIAKPQLIIVGACLLLLWEEFAGMTRRTRHGAVGANAAFRAGGSMLAWPAKKGRGFLGRQLQRHYPGTYSVWQELFRERRTRRRGRRRRP